MILRGLRHRLFPIKRAVLRFRTNVACGIELARRGEPFIPYLGSPIANLGDVALRQVIQRLFGEIRLVPFDERSIRQFQVAKQLGARIPYYCLGGGTLMNSPQPLPISLQMTHHGLKAFSFGTGVRDPAFWNNVPGYPRDMAKWAAHLRSFEHLTVRGPLSARVLRAYGVDHARVIGDPVLCLWAPPCEDRPIQKRIAINVGKSLGRFWGKDEDRVLGSLHRVAQRLLAQGFEIVVVSVWDRDHPIANEFAATLDPATRVRFAPIDADAQGFIDLVRTCDLMIALKLHAGVLAMCGSVPVVSVGYQPKCRDFMESMRLEKYNIRADRADAETILRLAHEAMERSHELATRIAAGARYYQNLLTSFAALVKQLYYAT